MNAGEAEVRGSLLKVAIGALCVAALLGIVGLLAGDFDESQVRVTLTALAISVYSVLAIPAFSALETAAYRALGAVTLGSAGAAFVLALLAIWIDDVDDDFAEAWGVMSVVALSCTHATLLCLRRRARDSEAVRRVFTATLIAVSLVGLAGVLMITGDDVDDGALRAFGVVAVLDALGTAVLPIMRRLAPQVDEASEPGGLAVALGLGGVAAGPASTFTVSREQLDAATDRAPALGAELLMAPASLPDGRVIAVIRDPAGEAFLFLITT